MTALTVTGLAVVAALAVGGSSEGGPGAAAAERALPRGPAEAILDLTRSGKEKWRSTLGDECQLDEVFVMVVDAGPEGYDVVSMPGDCRVNRFTVAPADGSVVPEDPLTKEDSGNLLDDVPRPETG